MRKKHLLAVFPLLIVFSCSVDDNNGGNPDMPQAVTNVTASRLEYADHIRITWDHVHAAGSYNVYRYSGKSDTALDHVLESETNVFDDSTAAVNTPWFYKVSSIKDGVESALSANFTEGIYSTVVDPFEPNDDISDAVEVSGIESTVLIYSFNEGEAQDTDWYEYTGGETIMDIVVTLPPGSPLDGYLMCKIDNNGTSIILAEGENRLSYSGSDDLYFSIYFIVADPDLDTVGSYDIRLDFY